MAQAASEQAGLWTRLLNFGSRRRVPVILQTEAAECGLACVAMVAAYHGRTTDLLTLRARFPSSLRGLTLQDVMEIAGTLGLVSRPVQVELDKLGQLYRPCILHWNLKHFVVLTKVHGDSIEIVDPARGRRRMKLSEVSKHFTGIALELEPSPRSAARGTPRTRFAARPRRRHPRPGQRSRPGLRARAAARTARPARTAVHADGGRPGTRRRRCEPADISRRELRPAAAAQDRGRRAALVDRDVARRESRHRLDRQRLQSSAQAAARLFFQAIPRRRDVALRFDRDDPARL